MTKNKKIFLFCLLVGTFFVCIIGRIWFNNKEEEVKKEQWYQSTEPYEVRIPYYNKKIELILKFPRCHYKYPMKDHHADFMYLVYPQPVFTGNIYEQYVCPKDRFGKVLDLKIQTTPNLEINGFDSHISNEYWIAKNGGKENLINAKNKMSLYKNGIDSQAILIDDFENKKHGLIISFTPYREDLVDSGFMQVYRVTSFLSEKFQIKYEVYTSRWLKNVDPAFTTQINSQFTDDFHDVIKNQGNILDHPEIIEQFIINNERVVQYIKAHSKEINK